VSPSGVSPVVPYTSEVQRIDTTILQVLIADTPTSKFLPSNGATSFIESTTNPVALDHENEMDQEVNVAPSIGSENTTL